MRSWGVATALFTVLFVGTSVGVAVAESNPPAKCNVVVNGEFPTCTQNPDGSWSVDYTKVSNSGDLPSFGPNGSGGPGIPSGFVALMILVPLIGIGAAIWRVSMARKIARDAGMDPDTATAVTLVGNGGLDATYLAANLRHSGAPARAAGEETAEQRLAELKGLLDKNLITQDEYDSRRKAIIDAV